LVLTPLLLGGCSNDSVKAAKPEPSGESWIVVADGRAIPSAPAGGRAVPRSAPASGFLPLPSPTPSPTPALGGTCPPVGAHIMNFATVVPGATTAAVTFYNPGGNALVEYRVTGISQDLRPGQQRDVGWTVLTPGTGCGYLTATVTGLDRRTHYAFSVDEVTTSHDRDGTVSATIARSGVVRTT
jgi:hypothetical protein